MSCRIAHLHPSSNYSDGAWVVCDAVVGGEKRKLFNLCLGYEYAVERILVNRWQLTDRQGVFRPHGKLPIAISDQTITQLASVNGKVASA